MALSCFISSLLRAEPLLPTLVDFGEKRKFPSLDVKDGDDSADDREVDDVKGELLSSILKCLMIMMMMYT
jgi:hypothetical protein